MALRNDLVKEQSGAMEVDSEEAFSPVEAGEKKEKEEEQEEEEEAGEDGEESGGDSSPSQQSGGDSEVEDFFK